MTRDELAAFCRALPGAYEDWPFGDEWMLFRHRENRKMFAAIFVRGGVCVNLKCEPMQAEFFRRVYGGVAPGYHMNKQHWNTVAAESDVPEEELFGMINHSYALTAPGPRGRGGVKNGGEEAGEWR